MQNHKLPSQADGIADQAIASLDDAGEQVSELTRRMVDTVRTGTHQLQDQMARVSDTTLRYIRDEPTKSLLIAAASGAALMALISLMFRARHHD